MFTLKVCSAMAANIFLNSLSRAINTIEQTIGRILTHRFPPGSIGALAYDFDGPASFPQQTKNPEKSFSLRDIISDGFLWAVPKHRRPLEKRMNRRYGWRDGHWKMLEPAKNIVMCPNCGHDHQVGVLCAHCYAIVREETLAMQEVIKKTLGLEPVEKEVVVIYENEKGNESEEFWKRQRIVEMPKKRPAWFHSNLTQSSTQEPSESKEVKPTELA